MGGFFLGGLTARNRRQQRAIYSAAVRARGVIMARGEFGAAGGEAFADVHRAAEGTGTCSRMTTWCAILVPIGAASWSRPAPIWQISGTKTYERLMRARKSRDDSPGSGLVPESSAAGSCRRPPAERFGTEPSNRSPCPVASRRRMAASRAP